MAESASAGDAHPCVGCGLCCNGVLYSRARARAHEHELLIAAGLVLEEYDDKTYFKLPCTFQDCGRCTNYENRFTVCREFNCALLRRIEAGELSMDSARETVAEALVLVDRVRSQDPDADMYLSRLQIRRSLAEEIRAQSGEERVRTGHRLLAMAALDLFLDRWFRNKRGGEESA